MRDYGKIVPGMWTGETGRALIKLGHTEALLAQYLCTGPHANMIGLYYLPIAYVAKDLASPFQGASKALRRVCETGFSTYDGVSEHVFVHEAAKYQIAESLSKGDKRCKGIATMLLSFAKVPMSRSFFERYRDAFHLPSDLDSKLSAKPLASPFEGPCKPLRSQDQEQEQEQEQEQVRTAPGGAALAPRRPKAVQTELVGAAPDDPSWRQVVDHWHRSFQIRTGKDPAWTPRAFGQLKQALTLAGGDHGEVVDRITVLFKSPPRFLADSPPDIATLVQHWDKLASPSGKGAPGAGLSVDELLDIARGQA